MVQANGSGQWFGPVVRANGSGQWFGPMVLMVVLVGFDLTVKKKKKKKKAIELLDEEGGEADNELKDDPWTDSDRDYSYEEVRTCFHSRLILSDCFNNMVTIISRVSQAPFSVIELNHSLTLLSVIKKSS